jgi:hypothetical protein
VVASTAIAVCAFPPFASAQTATAPALKAAFLYNFAKFTEWPADVIAPGAALMLCVINDRVVGEALRALAKGNTIDGHEPVVRNMTLEAASVYSCHLLYMSGLDERRSAALLESTKSVAVLTLSDADRFAERGGVAQLYVDKGTMAFSINLDAMRRAGILLSSKLLSLARIVKDAPHVR